MSHRFQIDLRGLIDLLSNHLYSSPRVFLRELLQNAVDAHTARASTDAPVEVTAPGDGTLVFRDYGIGLTEAEVHSFLATIGRSSKRAADGLAVDFLGQFGIGLLACFVVSEDIVVLTRSAKEASAPVLRWEGHADGTYALTQVALDFEPGTQVTLRAKPTHATYFEPAEVGAALSHYGSLLPHAIVLHTPNGAARIDVPPPWRDGRLSGAARVDALLEYGRQAFGEQFLDVIELHSETGGVRGVALVKPYATVVGARRADRVYVKGMLLSDSSDDLLPDWAFFVRALIDVADLRPLASREGLAESEELAAARVIVGDSIKGYLRDLARTAPRRLQGLLALHHQAIKQVAAQDLEFLSLVGPWLPFQTSAGRMSLKDYCERESILRVAPTVDDFREVAPIIEAEGGIVINGGYAFESVVLSLFADLTERELDWVDAAELVLAFDHLELDQRAQVAGFLHVAELALQPFRVVPEVRRFRPETLPALYSATADAEFQRGIAQTQEISNDLWSEVLGELAAERPDQRPRLTFNFECPTVRRLCKLDDTELIRRLVEVIFVQTLLMGHHPLGPSEMWLLNQSVTGLIEWSLDQRTRVLQ